MKFRCLPLFIALFSPFLGASQVGVGYYDSKNSFVGINYGIGNRFVAELRIHSQPRPEFLADDRSPSGARLEPTLLYMMNKENPSVDNYIGIGLDARSYLFSTGMNMYPFEEKSFGFLAELSLSLEEEIEFRASWGIRYRFAKD